MTMKNIVKKIGMMLLTMVIVSFFAFLAFQIIPGDPTTKLLGSDATAEAVAALRAELGLDRPFFTRYFEWMLNALRGDFGTSYVYAMPVASLLHGKLGVTALLTAIAFVLIVAVSLPVGLFAASRQGGWLDRALTVLGQVVMAVPPFVVGILLTLLCGLVLRWFDPGAFISPDQSFWRSVGYLIYPAVAIALPRIAMTVRMLKSSIVGELNKDYVRTAYSRGNSPRATLYRHVLRNALVPVVTFLAQTMAEIVEETEKHIDYEPLFRAEAFQIKNMVDAISHATCCMACDIGAKTIVVSSLSGATVRMVSRFRVPVDIVGMATNERVWYRLALSWGVQPILCEETFTSTDVLFYNALHAAKKAMHLHKGDNIVMTAGNTNGASGNTNLIKVETI